MEKRDNKYIYDRDVVGGDLERSGSRKPSGVGLQVEI